MNNFKRGNWTDSECFYVDAVDGDKFVLLAGPFQTLQQAEQNKDKVAKAAMDYGDPKAVWYSYGCCKMENGYREGTLNKQVGI